MQKDIYTKKKQKSKIKINIFESASTGIVTWHLCTADKKTIRKNAVGILTLKAPPQETVFTICLFFLDENRMKIDWWPIGELLVTYHWRNHMDIDDLAATVAIDMKYDGNYC